MADDTVQMWTNVGVLDVEVRDPTFQMWANLGLYWVQTDIDVPQRGWGVPMVPAYTIPLRPEDAVSTEQMWSNVTDPSL